MSALTAAPSRVLVSGVAWRLVARTYVASAFAILAAFVVVQVVRSASTGTCTAGGCEGWSLTAFLAALVTAALVMTVVGVRLRLPAGQHVVVVGGWVALLFLAGAGVLGWGTLFAGVLWPGLVGAYLPRLLTDEPASATD